MIKINNKIIGSVTIKNKQKPVYSGMEVLSMDKLFEIKIGGDVSKINYQDDKDECYKYPIYSNYISNYGLYGYSDTFKINEESITITARGTIGKTFYRNTPFTPIGRLLYLKSKKEDIDMKYFSYLIDNIGVEGEGGVISSLTAPMIKKYELKFFSNIHQQKKISDALSQQEEQVNNIKTLISKLEKRNQYYAERLLSGELRVREGDDGKIEFYENTEWKEVKINGRKSRVPFDFSVYYIKDFFNNNMGQTILSKNINPNKKKGIPVFSATEKFKIFGYVSPNIVNNNRVLNNKDLVVTARGTIGAVHKMKMVSTSTQTTIQCHKKQEDFDFIYYYLKTFRKKLFKQEGGAVPQLTVNDLNNIGFYFQKEEFFNISEILNKLNIELNEAKLILKKEQKRFEWMSDALLSGEYQIVD